MIKNSSRQMTLKWYALHSPTMVDTRHSPPRIEISTGTSFIHPLHIQMCEVPQRLGPWRHREVAREGNNVGGKDGECGGTELTEISTVGPNFSLLSPSLPPPS